MSILPSIFSDMLKSKSANTPAAPKKAKNTTQNSIPITAVYPNGVIQTYPGIFVHIYRFDDASFLTLSADDQESLCMRFSSFLNTLEPNRNYSIVFNNRVCDTEAILNKIAPAAKSDGLNLYRDEEKNIIKSSVSASRKGFTTDKYFVASVKSASVDDAMSQMASMDVSVQRGFNRIAGTKAEILNADAALEVLSIMENGQSNLSYFSHDLEGKTHLDWDLMHRQHLTPIDVIAPTVLAYNHDSFQIGDRYAQAMYISHYANYLKTSFLAALSETAYESIINIHITPLDTDTAMKDLKRTKASLGANIVENQKKAVHAGYNPDLVTTEDEVDLQQIEDIIDNIQNSDTKMFRLAVNITHFAPDMETLKQQSQALQSIAKNADGTTIKATIQQQERGFNACLPLGIYELYNDRAIDSSGLEVFQPFREATLLQDNGTYYGINQITQRPIAYNRKTGARYTMLILGATGSGKSVTVKQEITLSVLSSDDAIEVLDPDGEYGPLVRAYNGQHIVLSPNSTTHMNPLDLDIDTSVDSESPWALKADFIISLVTSMLHKELTSEQFSILNRCISEIYLDYAHQLERLPALPDGSQPTIDYDSAPTFQTLMDKLMSQREPVAQELGLAIEPYTSGPYGMFSHRTNIDINNRFIVYDLSSVPPALQDIAIKICNETIFMHTKANARKGIYTRCYMDEFHLNLTNPVSAQYALNMWKRFRKFKGMPCGITQNPSDLLESEYGQKIINNTSFYILKHLEGSDIESLRDPNLLNLSQTDCEVIATADRPQGLLWIEGRTVPFNNIIPENTELYKLFNTD